MSLVQRVCLPVWFNFFSAKQSASFRAWSGSSYGLISLRIYFYYSERSDRVGIFKYFFKSIFKILSNMKIWVSYIFENVDGNFFSKKVQLPGFIPVF